MEYKVHLSGTWGYTDTVEAENEEDARSKAEFLLEDLDSSHMWMEHEDTVVWSEDEGIWK